MARRLVQTGEGVNNRFTLKKDANGPYIDWNGSRMSQGAFPAKSYSAVLTQAGTAAPTAAVKNNSLSAAVVWTRTGAGVYVGTLTGAFPAGKTFAVTSQLSLTAAAISVKAGRIDDNTFGVNTFAANGTAADFVGDLFLTINVMP